MIAVGYIGEFEWVDDHRAGKIVVELNGRLNKCGVISPRFDVGVKEIESWTARLLPSRQVTDFFLLFGLWSLLFRVVVSGKIFYQFLHSLAILSLQLLLV